jgi:hypothetical protein
VASYLGMVRGSCGTQKKIVEILSPRTAPQRVREIVELLYHRESSLTETVAWRLLKQAQAHPAEFLIIEGMRCTGQIICGHNPWLFARLVDNLIINTNADGNETASWTDRYSVDEIAEKVRRMQGSDRR